MQIIRWKVPYNFNIFCYSCKHTGSLLSSQSTWEKMLDMVCSEYDGIPARHNYCVDHGDCIEAIAVDDKRFDLQTTTAEQSQADRQAQRAIDERKDIRKQLITVLKGNHEHKILNFGNKAQLIAEQLGVMYGTYQAVIHYVDRKDELLFKHFAMHGANTISSVAEPEKRKIVNMEISLIRKFRNKFPALLNTMGHVHKMILAKPDPLLYLDTKDVSQDRWLAYKRDFKEANMSDEEWEKEWKDEKLYKTRSKMTMVDFFNEYKNIVEQKHTEPKKTKGYIEPNHRWYAAVGSFLRTLGIGFDSYSERAGYDPLELGWIIAKVRDRKLIDVEEVVPSAKKNKNNGVT